MICGRQNSFRFCLRFSDPCSRVKKGEEKESMKFDSKKYAKLGIVAKYGVQMFGVLRQQSQVEWKCYSLVYVNT